MAIDLFYLLLSLMEFSYMFIPFQYVQSQVGFFSKYVGF